MCLKKYDKVSDLLDFSSEKPDLKFLNNGNVAIIGTCNNSYQVVAIIERLRNFSFVYLTGDGNTTGYIVNTIKLMDYLEIDLNCRLDEDDNSLAIRAFAIELPNIL